MEISQQESTPCEEPYFLKPDFFLTSSVASSPSVLNHAWLLLLDSLPVLLPCHPHHVLLRNVGSAKIAM
ncbi:uncharacterized protein J3R85_002936 [Psidium guajava]|nr:uncharacterized protein J3R85_002936 [Psidium guajava]